MPPLAPAWETEKGLRGPGSGGPPCRQTLGAPPLGWGLGVALTFLWEALLTTGDLHPPFLRKRLLFLLT